MTAARQSLGRAAEEMAAQRLGAAGARVVARNARTRYGEIDIVALDRGALVFVEVKAARAGRRAGALRPAFAVDRRKQARLRSLAAAYLASRPPLPRFSGLRFDVIGVTFDSAGRLAHWEHIRGAF